MKNKEEDGKLSLTLSKSLIYDFRTTVKKSGYTQKFLVTRVLEEIIEELKRGERIFEESKHEGENTMGDEKWE